MAHGQSSGLWSLVLRGSPGPQPPFLLPLVFPAGHEVTGSAHACSVLSHRGPTAQPTNHEISIESR